jgi:hypothetical protein
MNLLDLIRHPHAYFEALQKLSPAPWRLAWLPALAGLIGGLSGALLSRPVIESQLPLFKALTGVDVPVSLLLTMTVLVSVVVSLITWLILWGMGHLGAGPGGRSGEVYAASFLAPLLWSLVLTVLALLLPPVVNVAPPDLSGLTGTALSTASQKYTAAVAAQFGQSPVAKFSSFMTYAVYIVQFWLAYIGFRVMTDDSGRSWKGVLYSGGLLAVLGAAALLVVGAAASLTGALG